MFEKLHGIKGSNVSIPIRDCVDASAAAAWETRSHFKSVDTRITCRRILIRKLLSVRSSEMKPQPIDQM